VVYLERDDVEREPGHDASGKRRGAVGDDGHSLSVLLPGLARSRAGRCGFGATQDKPAGRTLSPPRGPAIPCRARLDRAAEEADEDKSRQHGEVERTGGW
jgi:hypothetical protein